MTEKIPDPPAPRDATLGPTSPADLVTSSEPQDGAVETRALQDLVATPPAVTRRWRLGRWTNSPLRRYLGWGAAVVAVAVAVTIVATFTIDLGPAVRARAEAAATNLWDREVTIGELGIRLGSGKFLVEDLVIAGLKPGDRPFLTAERIYVSIDWLALRKGELLVHEAEMINWRMLAELFLDGTMNFPAFVERSPEGDETVVPDAVTADTSEEDEGWRFVQTLEFLRAHHGEFILDDHGANYGVICANLDLTITKIIDYRGHASCSGGSIRVGGFEPLWMDLATDFELDGAQIHLTRVNLETDGASTVLVGDVDAANLPEMTFQLESEIDLTRMREIFFADYAFTASGEGLFTGTFHTGDSGYDLHGSITSPVFGVDTSYGLLKFPRFAGQLVWQPDRFDMWDMTATFLGGGVRAELATLGTKDPWQGIVDLSHEGVDVERLAQLVALNGLDPVSRASGHHRLQWPMETGGVRVTGAIQLEPPEGVQLAPARVPPGAAAAVAGRAGQPPDLTTRAFPLGGSVDYAYEAGSIELTSGYFATESTHATFDGHTGAGSDTRIPFQVASTDWQESFRLMTSVMTAAGADTDPFEVDGVGTFVGVWLGDLAAPRIEARFTGEGLRAWNVVWGTGGGDLVVDVHNSYLYMTNGVFRHDEAELYIDGKFSLGGARDDGGEETDTRFSMSSFPVANIRAAFGLEDGYNIEGPATGEAHLYGAYGRPFGVGRLTLDHPVVKGEPFDSASAGLRFEGDGLWFDGFEARKGDGVVTGAVYIGWPQDPETCVRSSCDASYSFNLDGRDVAVETIVFIPESPDPLSGTLQFNWSGVGSFDNPRYEIQATITDLFIGDEELGQATGSLNVRDEALRFDIEAASSTIEVSASGRVALTGGNDADLTFLAQNVLLDPYVRVFAPELSPYLTAVVHGRLRVVGELYTAPDVDGVRVVNWDHLHAEADIEQVDLSLFDYEIRNDGPGRLTLDRQVVGIEGWQLVGKGSALELSGSVGPWTEEVALQVDGTADLGMLQTEVLQRFFPDLRTSGDAIVRAEVSGSYRQPVLTGQATLSDGRIRHISLPHGFDEIDGRFVFERGGIRLDEVSARMGGGAVRIGGRVGLNGFTPGELDITVTGQEMQLRYPEGFRWLIDADLDVSGDASAPVVGGEITVLNALLFDGRDLGAGLFGLGDEEDAVVVSAAEEPALPLGFDIRIFAPGTLKIKNNTADVVASAELTLQGTADRPLLFGTAEIDSADAFFLGIRYRANYGTIDFANPTRIEPFVNIGLEADVRVTGQTYRVEVEASGTFDRLVPTLTSDPPLPEGDIISLLCGDIRDPRGADLRAARAPELAQQQRLQACAAQQFTSTVSSGVGRAVGESFGVDTFQITPSFGGLSSQQSAQLNPTARVLIGKRISDRAHLTLSRALSGANDDLLVVLEYDQSGRLSWILSQNEDRTYALDFRVRHAF